jgi:hydrogenase maturation protein HypF
VQIRRRIEVSGIVQGVGFRPYIYRLATDRRLAGTITNTSSGVTIEVQGPQESVDDFLRRFPFEAPRLAHITDVSVCDVPCNGDREFRIDASRTGDAVHTLISPDVATCDDCLRELLDPKDRRYHYPFINCTNCGPRFTIVRNIPYDRPRTSMAIFRMCAGCQAEHDDPLDRRFHAQPNACWDCGPQLQFWNREGQVLKNEDPILAAVTALQTGQIVAIKGLGGFHLAADATNAEAINVLRERKRRVEKPFAIMVPSLDVARELCEVDETECDALQSVRRPIVLVRRRECGVIAEQAAPYNRDLGIFLPYTPLHHLLFAQRAFKALVMTSGNLSEEPIAIDNDEARVRLGSLADFFLVHNREILLRCDDSVVRVSREGGPSASSMNPWRNLRSEAFNRRDRRDTAKFAERVQQLRRSRGFVPAPIFLQQRVPPILAVGGELKNTICLTKDNHAFLSQHIGDLENLESYKFFEEAICHLQNILEIKPRIIAHDLHPDYFSTKWALQQKGLELIGVQHHHAHIASCMAENHLDGSVIGFALDGTGYGTDGNIWGGEVLVASYNKFERTAHFEYVPLPGGAAAIYEPWRMALSYLAHHFSRDFLKLRLPFLETVASHKLELLLQMIERKVNSPLTSSCGRLFDAVAALIGIRQQINYEAQAAIELEMEIGDSNEDEVYPFDLTRDRDSWIIGTRSLFQSILGDISLGVPAPLISARFHNGLVAVLAKTAALLREQTGLGRVCLSGGTFNNVYLVEHLRRRLLNDGFQVFAQNEVPSGDGGLSLGQAMIAAHKAAGRGKMNPA